MVRILLLALCLAPIAVLTPILEIGPTHVFNPDWPGHARLHEVWQLISNALLAGLALWFAVSRRDMKIASLLGLLVNSAFLASVLMAPLYDGTMRHSDGTEIAVGGVNLAVTVMVLSTIGLLGLYTTARRQPDYGDSNGAKHP
ncbi:MAG TPA: hypothetical protein VFV06_06765 [Sphingorhabdus sp.]|nr:hypothetical protein [Sphingorhabdus sp.]